VEYREYAARAAKAAAADRALSELVHVVVGVRPRLGREELTVQALRARARELCDRRDAP
jgi:hypothetical protein